MHGIWCAQAIVAPILRHIIFLHQCLPLGSFVLVMASWTIFRCYFDGICPQELHLSRKGCAVANCCSKLLAAVSSRHAIIFAYLGERCLSTLSKKRNFRREERDSNRSSLEWLGILVGRYARNNSERDGTFTSRIRDEHCASIHEWPSCRGDSTCVWLSPRGAARDVAPFLPPLISLPSTAITSLATTRNTDMQS